MRVEAIKQAGRTGIAADDFIVKTAEVPESASESRALVVTAAPLVAENRSTHRQAAFLAHLIATKDQAPQTRARRRAEPSEAITAYRTVAAMTRA